MYHLEIESMNERTIMMALVPLLVMCLAVTPNVEATSITATINKPPQVTTLEEKPSCSVLPIAFSAHKNDIITGTFGSYDFPISFYVLSQNDLNSLQKTCHLSANASPLFIEENMAGTGIPYRTVALPDNATYYFVFVYMGSASPVQLTAPYDTVTLSYPSSLTVTSPANVTLPQLG